jgi:hypothetical protein
MDRETAKFVFAYRDLVFKLEKSKTEADIVAVLYATTGGNILPKLVFQTTTGSVKEFKELYDLAYDLLLKMLKINTTEQIVCNFLTLNLEKLKHRSNNTRKKPPQAWPFVGVPNSVEQARKLLLEANFKDNRAYFTVTGTPRLTVADIMQHFNFSP